MGEWGLSFLKSWKNKISVNNTTTKDTIFDYNIFTKFLCHRIPERTFNIRGYYFPVCSRCTGFYLAGSLYFILAYFIYIPYTIPIIILASLMLIPTFLDGFTQLLGLRESNNVLRFFTGLVGGVGLAILLKAIKWAILMG